MKSTNQFSIIYRKASFLSLMMGIVVFCCIVSFSSCLTEDKLDQTNYVDVTIKTNSATTITSTTALVSANFSAPQERTLMRGICAAKTINPTNSDIYYQAQGSLGTFSVQFYNLEPGTKYYARAYAINGAGTIEYGNQISFTTLNETGLPVLTTTSVSSILSTSAKCGGTISSDGGYSITARGVCWSTYSNPTVLDSKTTDGTGTGTYTSTITGLTPNMTYYVRAYAINSYGTNYGSQISFSTTNSTGAPAIITIAISNVTNTTASSGGYVTSAGGSSVTAKGVCWSTSSGPTIADSKTSDGTGAGTFGSSISGLTANTTYYVRSYATNSYGTSYGNELILKTFTGTVTDMDGNVYHTVTIGTQVWMVENLRTTKYRNGTSIPLVTDTTAWNNLSTPGYCWPNNDATTYKNTYGALYNWYTVNTGLLAPTGWHVPTDAEWTTLTAYLGGVSVAGGKLKEAGTAHWNTPNVGATNETGFTALPAGWRNLSPTLYYSIGYEATWWSATSGVSSSAWCRDMGYSNSNLPSGDYNNNYGFSVRCVKD